MKVRVYRNLHKRCWSVRAAEGPDRGRLVAHRLSLALLDCRLVVSQTGRERVLREGRRNVHAYIEGDFYVAVNGSTQRRDRWKLRGRVRYNPYRAGTFRLKPKGRPTRPIRTADAIMFLYDREGTCEAYDL